MSTHDYRDRRAAPIADDDSIRFYVRKVQRHPVYVTTRAALRSCRQLLPELWRRATCQYRTLPSALIIGAGKAGTTQLYSYLLRHPRCFGGRRKEVNYFSKFHDRPLRWYRAQFPLSRRLAKVRGLCIEASPSYLPSSEAVRRMGALLPEAKLIALLRDPVARAFSHYQHEKTRHRDARSFVDVVREEIAAHPPGYRPPLRPDGRPALEYVARGYYAMHLEALWQVYPRQQVLILDSADLFADTNAICQRVFDFLGLERLDISPGKIFNRGHYREVIDPTAAELLREHYRPHDQRLIELLGRPFHWMNSPTAPPTCEAAALLKQQAAA